jgi:uncharacterized damage-inducible protein DinB
LRTIGPAIAGFPEQDMTMRRVHLLAVAIAGLVGGAPEINAQPGERPGPMGDVIATVSEVEEKLVSLAKALPPKAFEWRPGQGVRSSGEVLLHVAADNYLIPGALGFAVPGETGIKGNDYKTAQTFEQRKLGREQTIAELERSFVYIKQQMTATKDTDLEKQITMFGSTMSMRRGWLMATTHLHEHLGQMIAYARTNGVAPPWTR